MQQRPQRAPNYLGPHRYRSAQGANAFQDLSLFPVDERDGHVQIPDLPLLYVLPVGLQYFHRRLQCDGMLAGETHISDPLAAFGDAQAL